MVIRLEIGGSAEPDIDVYKRQGSFLIIIFYCEIVILAIVKWGGEELKRQTDKKQR